MTTRRRTGDKRLVRALLIVLVLAASASLASAQCEPEPDVSDQARAAARQHYTTGIEASTAQRWVEARAAFTRAYDLAPLTPVVYNLATAQAQTGMLVEAAEGYRRFLRRCRSQDTPELRADAQQLLAGLSPRIGRLTLRVENLAEGVDRIELDGAELPPAVVGSTVPINPGAHELSILRQGNAIETRSFEIAEGQTHTMALTVPVYSGPAPATGGTVATGGGFDWGLFLGITGALVVAGAVAGIVAAVLLGGDGAQRFEDGTWDPVTLPLLTF